MAYKTIKVDPSERIPDIEAEGVKISLKNFSGNRFNKGGERNFRFVIEDPELADALSRDGWNVHIKQSDEGDTYMYLPVSLGYKIERLAPSVWMDINGKRTKLTEETVGNLDEVYIDRANLIIRPGYSVDDVTGERHIKAWLRVMYAFVVDDYDPWAKNYETEEE